MVDLARSPHLATESKTHIKVVAAIPCHNTARSIAGVVSKTLKYAAEVVVIDDGSRDSTAEVARAAGARVIQHSQNQGYGGAIKSCFAAARDRQADILVIIDGDGQHNPDEIPLLLSPLFLDEADLSIGSRFLDRNQKIPRYRKFGIGVITFLWNFGSQIKVTDTQSGFRAYKKFLFRDLSLAENGMSISIEILEKMKKSHPRIQEVPITCSYVNNNDRLNSKAITHGLGVALAVLKIRLKYAFAHHPPTNLMGLSLLLLNCVLFIP